jgi:hypothetical protein
MLTNSNQVPFVKVLGRGAQELPLGDKIFNISAYAEDHACVPKLL